MELILWLTGGFLSFGEVTKSQFERSAAAELRSILGNQGKVTVSTRPNLATIGGHLPSAKIVASDFTANGLPLYTEPSLSKRGRLDRLGIELKEFTLRGLLVQSLTAQIPNCRFDLDLAVKRRKFRLSQSGEGTGTVNIRAADLERFILLKYPSLKSCHLSLNKDRAIVEGETSLGTLPIKFRIEGRMESADGRSLRLVEPTAVINGAQSSDSSARALASSINPVLHLDRDLGLSGAVDIQTISLQNNQLMATAKTRIPVSLAYILGNLRFSR